MESYTILKKDLRVSSKHPATVCDHCKANKAVVHITQITEDKISASHYCKECASIKGIAHAEKSMKSALHDFLGELEKELPIYPEKNSETVCSFCGMGVGAFQRTGRLGCPHCYTDFNPYLKKILKKIHGSSLHVGKVYLPPDPRSDQLDQKLEFLRKGMTRAIQREEFEKAALLRDEITRVESRREADE